MGWLVATLADARALGSKIPSHVGMLVRCGSVFGTGREKHTFRPNREASRNCHGCLAIFHELLDRNKSLDCSQYRQVTEVPRLRQRECSRNSPVRLSRPHLERHSALQRSHIENLFSKFRRINQKIYLLNLLKIDVAAKLYGWPDIKNIEIKNENI